MPLMLYNIELQKHKESSGESGIVIESSVVAFHHKWVGKVKKCPGIFSGKFSGRTRHLLGSNSSTSGK